MVLSRYVIVVKCEFNSVVLTRKFVHTLYCILCMVVKFFIFAGALREGVNLRNETFTFYFRFTGLNLFLRLIDWKLT